MESPKKRKISMAIIMTSLIADGTTNNGTGATKEKHDEEGIQYNISEMTVREMPTKTMTYLRMNGNSFPIVLNKKNSSSNFDELLTHVNQNLN